MAELPPGYRDIPPEDRKKAQVFFDRAKTVADSGQYDYAIELYLQGLSQDPDAREAHQALRDVAMKRKASGGKSLGMIERMKLSSKGKDDKVNMLSAEKLLAYDPGSYDYMLSVMQSAHKAGYYDTALWVGSHALLAMVNGQCKDANKFLLVKDIYKDLRQWQRAIEACKHAAELRGNDMDLQGELKNLAAEQTMSEGKYEDGGSFRSSMRDKDFQERLIEESRDFKTDDMLTRRLKEAEAEYKAEPHVEGKLIKYVEALEGAGGMEHENQAIDALETAYARTKQFRFRERLGRIRVMQMTRMLRSLQQAMEDNPGDEELKKDYEQFKRELTEMKLEEAKLASEAYPSVLAHRFEMGARLFELERYDEAIPALQQARSDPKMKTDASVMLGRSFLEAGFVDEAVETLQVVIEEYQIKGDDRSKEMYYWQGRAYEEKGTPDMAIKRYSQVAQWEFTYKDVQKRIKELRAAKK